jgi:hypothetical protein
MSVDIVYGTRFETRMSKGMLHRQTWALAIFTRRCHVVRITGEAIASNLGINLRASLFCMLQFLVLLVMTRIIGQDSHLEHNYTGTFSDDKARSIFVERATGFCGAVVPVGS